MAAYGYEDNKQQLLKRLSRAEGQLRGISRMVASDTYCIDILTQISAAHAALDKVAVELIRDHARSCLKGDGTSIEIDRRANELASAVDRLL